MAIVLETPFDPQALYTALSYLSNVFNAASWQNLLKMFFMIALINGIVSMAFFRQVDYLKQFIIALVFSSVLAAPIGDTIAIKRADTEKIYTINNSKAPWVLVQSFGVVNSVTKWFTKMAGASINSPTYTGMYDAGIGSSANIIRNSMDITFRDPAIRADLTQFIKECTLYDLRDGVISLDALMNQGNGFELIFSNTSPARFVSMQSVSGNAELKTCRDAATYLNSTIDRDVGLTLQGKAANFFYTKDVAPMVVYSTAIQNSYNTQLSINENVSKIVKQNMFNHLLEVSGPDIAKLVGDPAMAENAAIHMGVARAAKKAAFQQSVVAQLGKELLPAMSSWVAIIIVMLFPFVILLLVVSRFNNVIEVFKGYLGTLFWICLWQPIFAIINNLANWELGRQLAKTGAFAKDGIPYGYVNTIYDSLINNHSLVGWMVILTPVIASAVAYGSYRGITSMGGSMFSTFSGSTNSVGNEMSDGNLSMGNTTLGNRSLNSVSDNNTQVNQMHTSPSINSGIYTANNGAYTTSFFNNGRDAVRNVASSNTGSMYVVSTSASHTIENTNRNGGDLTTSKGVTYGETDTKGKSVNDTENFTHGHTQSRSETSQNGLVSNNFDNSGSGSGSSMEYNLSGSFGGSETNTLSGTAYASANVGIGAGGSGGGGLGLPGFAGGSGGGRGGGKGVFSLFNGGANVGVHGSMTQGYSQVAGINDSVAHSGTYNTSVGNLISQGETASRMSTNQIGQQSSHNHSVDITDTQSAIKSSSNDQGVKRTNTVGYAENNSISQHVSFEYNENAGHFNHQDALFHSLGVNSPAMARILQSVGYDSWDDYQNDDIGYRKAQAREIMNQQAFLAVKEVQKAGRPNWTDDGLDKGYEAITPSISKVDGITLPNMPNVVNPDMLSHEPHFREHSRQAEETAKENQKVRNEATNKAINNVQLDPSAINQLKNDDDSWIGSQLRVIEAAMGGSNYTPK